MSNYFVCIWDDGGLYAATLADVDGGVNSKVCV
jgi:hypothetical protein